MLYVNSLVLDYPACVSFKEVIKRLAESGSDGKLWSDAKGELPMLTKLSPIQSRSKHHDYYFPDEKDGGNVDCGSDELQKFGWPDFVFSDRELKGTLTEEQPDMGWLIDQIQEHAKNHDWKIFEITNVKISK